MISLFKSLTSYFQLRKDHFLKTNWKQFWISSKTKRFRGLDEIPSEVWKTRSFNYILFEAGNATYNQSSIEIWTRGCILPFINKVDLSLTTNYRETTLKPIAAKIYISNKSYSTRNRKNPTTKWEWLFDGTKNYWRGEDKKSWSRFPFRWLL